MIRVVAKQSFTMIPDEIMALDMSFAAKCLYGYVCRKANPNHGFWSFGGRFLADLWKTNQSQIVRALHELEQHKLIQKRSGKSGERAVYLIQNRAHLVNKASHIDSEASHIDSVPGAQSESDRLGASHIDSEASHIDSRMRQRPLETKHIYTDSPKSVGRKKADTGHESQNRTGIARLRVGVVALFYPSGVPDGQQKPLSVALANLARFSATPEEVCRRHKRWSEMGYTYPCTLNTLMNHWDRLKPKVLDFTPKLSAREEALARKETEKSDGK